MMAMLTLRFSWTIVAISAHGHLESAVAHHHPYFRFGTRDFRANCRGSANPIVPSPPEVISERGCFTLEVLRFPHLVLAYIGHDDRVAVTRLAREIVDHVRRIKMSAVRQILNIPHRRIAFQLVDMIEPLGTIDGFNMRQSAPIKLHASRRPAAHRP